jgi:hypothetical protein
MKTYVRSSANRSRRSTRLRITAAQESAPIFTPENFAELLSQLPEMQGYNVSIGESPEGTLQFIIGDNIYDCMGI